MLNKGSPLCGKEHGIWECFNIVTFNGDGDGAKITVEDMQNMRKEEFVAYMEEYMDESNFNLLNA